MPRTVAAPLPLPRITARGALVAAALWALYALLYAAAIVVFAGAPLAPVLIGQAMHAALMFALSAVPWWVLVRGMAERPARQRLAAHALSLALYTAAVCALIAGFASLGGPDALAGVMRQIGWIGFSTAFAYIAQFAVYHAVEASRRGLLREEQAEALRHLAREQELRTLRAHLNPHFLFNALNTVNAQIGRDPGAAQETVGRLADLLRYTLDAGRRDALPLAEEVAFVRAYLDLEQARMGPRLRAEVRVAPEANALVPPMAIQTLVENAVRHAVAPNPTGGTVCVEITPEASGADSDSGVRVVVRDTGIGAGVDAPGAGTGLANTDERLRLLFGPGAALHTDRDPAGWTASFTLPTIPDSSPVPPDVSPLASRVAPLAPEADRAHIASGDGAVREPADPA